MFYTGQSLIPGSSEWLSSRVAYQLPYKEDKEKEKLKMVYLLSWRDFSRERGVCKALTYVTDGKS